MPYGQYSRAVSNQERVIVERIRYIIDDPLNFNLKMDSNVGTLRGMKRVGGDAPHLKNDVC